MAVSSPSSYVFYPERLTGEITRKEGTRLVRLFVTDRTLTIFEKEIVRTRKSGVLFEKVLTQQTLALHENSHGQKYLKFFKKSHTGGIKDVSLLHYFTFSPRNYVLLVTIRETLLGWFDAEIEQKDCNWYRGLSLSALVSKLMFPVTRDPQFLDHSKVYDLLRNLHAIGHPVLRLLRECQTWDEFLQTFFPTLQTEDDVSLLEGDILQLSYLAVLPLGISLTSFKNIYGADSVSQFKESFSAYDHTLIRFMMENSIPKEREGVVRDLMALVAMHSEAKRRSRETWSRPLSSSGVPTRPLDFDQIPRHSWPELSTHLRSQLSVLRSDFAHEGEDNLRLQVPVIETRLNDAVRGWYAERFFEPRMKTDHSVTDVETRFFELFHAAPCGLARFSRFAVMWREAKEGVTFMRLPLEGPTAMNEPQASDLILLLIKMVPRKKFPKMTGRTFNAYVAHGKIYSVVTDAYSIDEVLSLIEAGTTAVDAELTRLGRTVTPENRTAYLHCDPKERKFKNTWKYYDWGVKDIEKVLALKKHGVKSKKEAQMYAALPDEMFYEFLSLNAGEEPIPAQGKG